MWNTPNKKRLEGMPKLSETEHIPLKEKLIYLHFFIAGCDWYACEYDGEDLFFGFAILNQDYEMAEWGFFSFAELENINIDGLEVDCEQEEFFRVKRAIEIDKIRIANSWAKEN